MYTGGCTWAICRAALFQVKGSSIYGFGYLRGPKPRPCSHEGTTVSPSISVTPHFRFCPFCSSSIPAVSWNHPPPPSDQCPHSSLGPLLLSGPGLLLTPITLGATGVLEFHPPKLSYGVHSSTPCPLGDSVSEASIRCTSGSTLTTCHHCP